MLLFRSHGQTCSQTQSPLWRSVLVRAPSRFASADILLIFCSNCGFSLQMLQDVCAVDVSATDAHSAYISQTHTFLSKALCPNGHIQRYEDEFRHDDIFL